MKIIIPLIINVLLCVIAALVLSGIIVGVFITRRDEVEAVCDGVIRLPKTTKNTGPVTNLCFSFFNRRHENSGGMCSAVVKKLSSGETIVGRNYDMTLSKHPIYIGSTEIPGFYPTVYVSNWETYGPTFDSCIEKGLPKYMRAAVPFMTTDSLNSEGLYMEINMRVNQKDEDGNSVFSCSGTNPGAPVRLYAGTLPSYVTMRCKNTEEAVALIRTLDIYTTIDEEEWPLCFIIADAEGNYGLLELGCNEVRWLPGQNIQTNYYISEDFNILQKYKTGLGRYVYIEDKIDRVESETDMLELMEDVKYSEIYNIDSPKFDIRSEFTGDEEYLTNEYLENEDHWSAFLNEFKSEAELFHSMSRDERREAQIYWISLYSTIANCSRKTLSLSFSEEYEISCILGFD